MSGNAEKLDDNPIWTRADFAKAQGPEMLPPHMLAAFPRTAARLRPVSGQPPSFSMIGLVEAQSAGVRILDLAA